MQVSEADFSAGLEHPLQNRYQDVLPYDRTRVKLQNSADDYINAVIQFIID